MFFVANRAHHADIGGATPGSMGLATDVYGEGLRLPPIRLVRAGEIVEDVMRLILANVRGACRAARRLPGPDWFTEDWRVAAAGNRGATRSR